MKYRTLFTVIAVTVIAVGGIASCGQNHDNPPNANRSGATQSRQTGVGVTASKSEFEAIFAAEGSDSVWAAPRQDALYARFGGHPSLKLLSAVCKTTICKLELEGQTMVNPSSLPLRTTNYMILPGDHTVTIYVSKPGYSLPTAPNTAQQWGPRYQNDSLIVVDVVTGDDIE